MNLKELEQEINGIRQRNKRVELDKKWETSVTRKICICILTYANGCQWGRGFLTQ